jgi:hypothetical protein
MNAVNWFRRSIVAAALAIGIAASASAQQQNGLVNVNLQEVAKNIAIDLNVDVSQIPVTVQAPIGVAANVCGIDANVLARQRKDGDVNCAAKSTSRALNQIVQRQVKK